MTKNQEPGTGNCGSAKPPRAWRPMMLWTAGGFVVFVAWLIGLGGYPLIQWSPLNSTHEDVDIRSGRIRTTHILAWIKASEQTENSALTEALSPADRSSAAPDWHRVNTSSPGVHYSPHYKFHAAIYQAHFFQRLCEYYHLGPQARREVALAVLQLWQEKGGDYPAGRFMNELDFRLGRLSGEPTNEEILAATVEALKKIRGEEAAQDRGGDADRR